MQKHWLLVSLFLHYSDAFHNPFRRDDPTFSVSTAYREAQYTITTTSSTIITFEAPTDRQLSTPAETGARTTSLASWGSIPSAHPSKSAQENSTSTEGKPIQTMSTTTRSEPPSSEAQGTSSGAPGQNQQNKPQTSHKPNPATSSASQQHTEGPQLTCSGTLCPEKASTKTATRETKMSTTPGAATSSKSIVNTTPSTLSIASSESPTSLKPETKPTSHTSPSVNPSTTMKTTRNPTGSETTAQTKEEHTSHTTGTSSGGEDDVPKKTSTTSKHQDQTTKTHGDHPPKATDTLPTKQDDDTPSKTNDHEITATTQHLSTITPHSISIDKVTTLSHVTENRITETADKKGHHTIVPVLVNCKPCGGGTVLAWGIGPEPGIYPPPSNPPTKNWPTIKIGSDGKPTPGPESKPTATADKPTASDDQSTETDKTTSSKTTSRATKSDSKTSTTPSCTKSAVTNSVVSCKAVSKGATASSCMTKTNTVTGCDATGHTSTTTGYGTCKTVHRVTPSYKELPIPTDETTLTDDPVTTRTKASSCTARTGKTSTTEKTTATGNPSSTKTSTSQKTESHHPQSTTHQTTLKTTTRPSKTSMATTSNENTHTTEKEPATKASTTKSTALTKPTLGTQHCHKESDYPKHKPVDADTQRKLAKLFCMSLHGSHFTSEDLPMSTENIHGGPSMINGVSWVKGCKTPKNMMDPMDPLGDSKHKCADLLIGDYTNCNNGGVGGYIDAGCLRYEFKPRSE